MEMFKEIDDQMSICKSEDSFVLVSTVEEFTYVVKHCGIAGLEESPDECDICVFDSAEEAEMFYRKEIFPYEVVPSKTKIGCFNIFHHKNGKRLCDANKGELCFGDVDPIEFSTFENADDFIVICDQNGFEYP